MVSPLRRTAEIAIRPLATPRPTGSAGGELVLDLGRRTVPCVTAAPASTDSPVMVPSLWAVTGFSIFMASSTTTRSPVGDLLTLFDGDLDDGALHGRGHRVTGGGGAAVRAALARLGLLADRRRAPRRRRHRRWRGHRAATPRGGVRRPRRRPSDAGQRVFLVERLTAGERLDGVVPLGLDPAGVDGEAVVVADERRVGHHGAVERDDGGQALDV